MSLEKPRSSFLTGILAASVIAGASCDNPRPNDVQSPIEKAKTQIATVLKETDSIDKSDGRDDLNETAILKQLQTQLDNIRQTYPDPSYQAHIFNDVIEYLTNIYQEIQSLKQKNDRQGEQVMVRRLVALDLRTVAKRSVNNQKHVAPDGTIKFATPNDEKALSLGDISPQDKFLFEIGSPQSVKAMRLIIEEDIGRKPVRVSAYRLNEDTEGYTAGQKKVLKKGTMVFSDRENKIVACIVHTGDRMIKPENPLYQPFEVVKPTDASFEKRISQLLPRINIHSARQVFTEKFPSYENILRREYAELLKFNGITIAEHFAHYLAWAEQKGLTIDPSSMRTFFDQLIKKIHEKPQNAGAPKVEESGIIDKLASLWDKTSSAVVDAVTKDEGDAKNMAYHDELTSEQIEAQIKDYGVIWAIIRQQGRFFDNFTYNRLSENYSARVSATVVDKKEKAIIQPLALSDDLPSDILEKLDQKQDLAHILNKTTQFSDPKLEKELRKALSESLEYIHNQKVSPSDFDIQYNHQWLQRIYYKGTELGLNACIIDPKWLKQVPQVQTIQIGNTRFQIDLKDYFVQYARLEKKNQASSQNIFVYDQKNDEVIEYRNPLWFVEQDVPLYRKIAQDIAGKSGQKDFLIALGTWIQQNLDYLDEFSEVNKISLATLLDKGGDCEDGTVLYRTLGSAQGYGQSIGMVLFSNHVAPIIRGNYGGISYPINGEDWTLYEMATHRGQIVPPGQSTKNRTPIGFCFDANTCVSAPGYSIARMAKSSELNSGLVVAFKTKVDETLAWLGKVSAELSGKMTAEKSLIYTSEFPEKTKSVKKELAKIIAAGKISPEIQSMYRQFQDQSVKVADQLADFHEKESSKLKWAELEKQPEHIKKALSTYKQKEKHLLENIIPTNQKLLAILVEWRREVEPTMKSNDTSNTLRISQKHLTRMAQVINQSQVKLDHDHMFNQYNQVLKHIPDTEFQQKLDRNFNEKADLVNNYIFGPYNVIAEFIETLIQ